MRARNVLIGLASLGFVGCGFANNGDDDGNGSDAGSNAPGPCVLPDLGLTAGTLSGCSDAGTTDGPRGTAKFNNPVNVAIGPSGVAYVVDFDSSLLRKVDPNGNVTTIFADPRFNRPFGIIIAPDGWLWVECDDDVNAVHGNTSGTIWKINPADPTGAVPVFQGLMRPRGLAWMNGKLAISDYLSMEIKIGDPTTGAAAVLAGAYGIATSVDGTGTGATFDVPWDIVVDPTDANYLLVTDWGDHSIRRVGLDGTVTTWAGAAGMAGSTDGALAVARFNNPKGLTVHGQTIYVTDSTNHTIRKIENNIVSTISGKVDGGYHDDVDPMAAQYYGIEGLDVSQDGTRLVIADGNNGDGSHFNHIRVLTLP
ncbi:MAG: hypothetical protein ABI678_02875 [Kofleriaceae bacterium]